ncbi:MAG: YSIRK-type signal peptide-containing protein [Lactobacillus kalixensis]|uniref:YSIRK-type signal peptide-containing protein n=1 Tax=Lactobacillus kalixensis TaxID=227944 RepID=UPI003992D41F
MNKHNIKFNYNPCQRFGFRKLSVGLVAVTLSTIFFLTTTQTAHADEIPTSEVSETKSENAPTVQTETTNQDNNQEQDLKKETDSIVQNNQVNDQKTIKADTGINNTNTEYTGSIQYKTADGKDLTSENQLQAGYNNVEIHTSISGYHVSSPQNTNFEINIGNAGDSDGSQAWIIQGFTKDSFKNVTAKNKDGEDVDRYQITYNGNGNFNIKVLGPVIDAETMEFNYRFNVIGNKNYVNSAPSKQADLLVTISANNSEIASKNVTTNIVPAKETVEEHEIAHIWTHGLVNDQSQFIPEDRKNNAKLLQFMIDWNLGEITDLRNVDFSEFFSSGQQLLPDTIKVFRVYKGILKDDQTSERLPWSDDTYNKVTGTFDPQTGLFSNEDTAFEEFLRSNLYVNINGQEQPISYEEFIRQFNNGTLPTVNKIQFHVDGPFTYTDSNGQVHNWSNNGGQNGENTDDTSITNPHSTFFIQMDTLLAYNMPTDWVIPGEGPSSEITTDTPTAVASGTGENGKTTFIGFNNGGSGFFNESSHTARLYFADVSDITSVKDLAGVANVPAFLNGENQEGATIETKIAFSNVEAIIAALNKAGYEFVGASNGTHISGAYDGSSLQERFI